MRGVEQHHGEKTKKSGFLFFNGANWLRSIQACLVLPMHINVSIETCSGKSPLMKKKIQVLAQMLLTDVVHQSP